MSNVANSSHVRTENMGFSEVLEEAVFAKVESGYRIST